MRVCANDSDRNAEARSTARQIESATRYAEVKGWTVDPRYVFMDDAVSGAEWKRRPGFNALLAALEPRPPFGFVIVSELSRIGRDTVRTPAGVLQLEEAGVEIRSYLIDAPISLADDSTPPSSRRWPRRSTSGCSPGPSPRRWRSSSGAAAAPPTSARRWCANGTGRPPASAAWSTRAA